MTSFATIRWWGRGGRAAVVVVVRAGGAAVRAAGVLPPPHPASRPRQASSGGTGRIPQILSTVPAMTTTSPAIGLALRRIFDDASQFPPGNLSLPDAVANHAQWRQSRWEPL